MQRCLSAGLGASVRNARYQPKYSKLCEYPAKGKEHRSQLNHTLTSIVVIVVVVILVVIRRGVGEGVGSVLVKSGEKSY